MARRRSISLLSYPEKLSAMKSLSSYSFSEWSTSTDCINFEESLILTQRSVNRLWNLDILQLTDAKNKTVASGEYSFLTAHFSAQALRWLVYMCIFPLQKAWAFCGTRTPQPWVQLWRYHTSKTLTFFSSLAQKSLHSHHQTSPCAAAVFFNFLSQQAGPGRSPACTERPVCWLGATAHLFL